MDTSLVEEDEIIEIVEMDYEDMVDIEVDHDHLFFANGILTHNSSSDPDMADVAESFGTTATADLILSIVSTDELKELDQRIIKQLKNRMGDINNHTSFVVGIDTKKMRLYDVGESGQSMLDTPVMDNSRVYTDERKKRLGGIKFE